MTEAEIEAEAEKAAEKQRRIDEREKAKQVGFVMCFVSKYSTNFCLAVVRFESFLFFSCLLSVVFVISTPFHLLPSSSSPPLPLYLFTPSPPLPRHTPLPSPTLAGSQQRQERRGEGSAAPRVGRTPGGEGRTGRGGGGTGQGNGLWYFPSVEFFFVSDVSRVVKSLRVFWLHSCFGCVKNLKHDNNAMHKYLALTNISQQ